VFFMSQNGWWHQQITSIIIKIKRNCWLISLLLETNNTNNNANQDHGWDVILGPSWEPTFTSFFHYCNNMPVLTLVPTTATMHSNNDLSSQRTFKQLSWVIQVALFHGNLNLRCSSLIIAGGWRTPKNLSLTDRLVTVGDF
jgi:hypothetical protein